MVNDWIVIFSVTTVASFIHGVLGFGDGLIGMPFLLMYYPLPVADTIATCYEIMLGIALTGSSLKLLSKHKLEVTILFIFYTIFTIVGLLVLNHVNQNILVIGLSVLLIIYPIGMLYFQKHQNLQISGKFAPLFAGLSGFLGAVTTLKGPPLVLYGQIRRFDKEVFVAILQPLLLYGSIISFYGYYKIGNFHPHLFMISLSTAPLILIITLLCRKIRHKIPDKIFSYLVMSMICLSGIIMLIKHL